MPLDLVAMTNRWRMPKAYDNGEIGMRRLFDDHTLALVDLNLLAREVAELRAEIGKLRAIEAATNRGSST